MKQLLIRTDANSKIGNGHVMRCLALGQAWQESAGNVTFLMSEPNISVKEQIKSQGFKVAYMHAVIGSQADAKKTVAFAKQMNSTWTVLDGYHFDSVYQRTLKGEDVKVLMLDDYGHADDYFADLILNQNINVHEGLYEKRAPHAWLLVGSRYTLLRKEFLKWKGQERLFSQPAKKMMITLGGADPDNVTSKIIKAVRLIKLDGLEVKIAVGSNNPHLEALQRMTAAKLDMICLLQNVTDMPRLMAWADLAVTSGGSTCYESAFMGLPAVVLVIAANQKGVAKGLEKSGVAVNLGYYKGVSIKQIADTLQQMLFDYSFRREMSFKGRALLDGKGGRRVVESMLSLTAG